MKKQIKQYGIAALTALMIIMAACNAGWIEKPDLNGQFVEGGQVITGGQTNGGEQTGNGGQTGGDGQSGTGGQPSSGEQTGNNGQPGGGEQGGNSGQPTLSSNANIRAVSGTGADALYGLYVGGMPGIDNGTPQATAEGFSNATKIALSGNYLTDKPTNNVVVIVEDKKVSKVEFGVTSTSSGSSNPPSNTAPSTWYTLTKNNDFTTTDTVDKRWVGPLTVAALTSSSSRGFYVRITAEDNTVQVYRYWQYISTTSTPSSNGITRGELSALSIGGVSLIASGSVQAGRSNGSASGWWNKTVSPDFTPGEVTLTVAQAASCAVSATANNGSSCSLSIVKISAGQWPLLDGSTLTFDQTGTSATNPTISRTYTNVANGDYILIRQNAPTTAEYAGLFTHYIIKVNVQ